MSATELILRDPLGERALSATDFPVSLGGPGRTVVLPGAGDDTVAWIALHEGQLFLQPAERRDPPPLVNGAPVTRPTWLREGDVVLVKASRAAGLEKVALSLLEERDGGA